MSYNPVTELIDIRHYTITVEPIGLSRGVKKVVLGKIPNLAKCEDIADFLTGLVVKKCLVYCHSNCLYIL